MPEFTVVSASDVGALALLTQYFADRETTFPPEQGVYRTTFPDPTQFLPPNGVFLLIGIACPQLGDAGRCHAPAHGKWLRRNQRAHAAIGETAQGGARVRAAKGAQAQGDV